MFRPFVLLLFFLPFFVNASIFDEKPAVQNNRGYLFEIHGSNTIGDKLAPALLEQWFIQNGLTNPETRLVAENEKVVSAYSKSNQKISIFIAAHGSGTGFEKLKSDQADIAAASRPAKQSENELFPTLDVTDYKHEAVLAIDGIAVIGNANLSIHSLNIDQIGQLFSGKITNWQSLGGPNLPVSIHARDNNSGTFDTFDTLVLKRGFKLSSTAIRYESNDVLSTTVSNTPGAIGFTSVASIGSAKALNIIDGDSAPMEPQHANIATEDYPLARRLYLYQVNRDNEFVNDFLTFTKSSEGQNVVAELGFISQNLTELPMTVKGNLPAGYAFITEKSNRITTNFRFVPGTKQLDNKALDDLVRLQTFMLRPENAGRKLILIGFSNQQKDEFKARLLSESRVISVKRELDKIGVVSSALTGYGQINPIASNADLKYALRNQRVEVWIR